MITKGISRRKFLKGAVIGVTAAATGKLVLPVQVQAQWQQAILNLIIGFAGNVLASIAANTVSEWISNLGSNEVETVNSVNNNLAFHNFSGKYTVPYCYLGLSQQPIHFYGVAHANGHNACAPFLVANQWNQPVLVGGANIAALFAASSDWTSQVYNAAQGLIPLAIYESSPFSQPFTSEQEAIYFTNAGWLESSYSPTRSVIKTISINGRPTFQRAEGEGRINITSVEARRNGNQYQRQSLLLDETYNISFDYPV